MDFNLTPEVLRSGLIFYILIVASLCLRAYAQAGGGANQMCGIAAPSANRFGRISPTDAAHVRDELGAAVSMILDGGPCAVGIESTILDLSQATARILRPGMLNAKSLAAVLGYSPEFGGTQNAPRVSGSLETHYAPQTPLRLVAAHDLAVALLAQP